MKTLSLCRLAAIIAFMLLSVACVWGQSPPADPGASMDTGVKPYQSYGGAKENISLTNGNLNLTVPLVHLKGRNGFDTDISLVYESKNWKIDQEYDSYTNKYTDIWQPETRWNNISYGWHLNIPTIDQTTFYNMDTGVCTGSSIITLADGGKYFFNNRVGCGTGYGGLYDTQLDVSDADDSSGMRLDLAHSGGPVAITRNGTRIYFSSTQGTAYKVEDANGNYISYGSSITDSLGRSITFGYTSSNLTSVSYRDSGGTSRSVSLSWTSVTLSGIMTNPTANLHRYVYYNHLSTYGSWTMPASVSYPNGLGFTFAYNGFGDLSKITYSTGGYTSYSYSNTDHLDRDDVWGGLYADFREVSERHVCRNTSGTCTSGQEDVTTYTATVSGNSNTYMDVVGPDGKLTRHEFTVNTAPGVYGTPQGMHEISTKTYDGSTTSSTLLQTITTGYDNYYAWGLPTESKTTLGSVTKKEQFDYDTYSVTHIPPQSYDLDTPDPATVTRNIDNVTEHREYDWGSSGSGTAGSQLRKTDKTWVKTNTISSTSYNYYDTSIRILSLPLQVKVYDGTTLKAQTDYEYDQSSLSSPATASTQHETPENGVARGNVTKFKRWLDTNSTYPYSTYTYYNNGNMYQHTDPGGHITTFDWTDNWTDTSPSVGNSTCAPGSTGNAYSSSYATNAYLKSITNALSQTVYFVNNSCTGTLAQSKDLNANKTQYAYDSSERLTTTTLPNGGGSTLSYSSSVPFVVSNDTKQDSTSGHDILNETQVDGIGRVVQTRLTSDPQGTVYVDTVYDAMGRTYQVSNPYRSGDTTYQTTTAYDALGRVTSVTKQDSSSATTSYSDNTVTACDEASHCRKSITDGAGRLQQVIEPNSSSGSLTSNAYNTYYTYSVLDGLLSVNQAGDGTGTARTRSYEYDSLGRVVKATNPESGTTCFGQVSSSVCNKLGYDSDSNLVYKTDARGRLATNSYDYLHRVTQKAYSDSTPTSTYTYDASSIYSLTLTNPIGRLSLASVNGCATCTVYSYDAMGRVLDTWEGFPSEAWSHSTATYNLGEGLTSLTYPSGRVVNNSYDSATNRYSDVNASFSGTPYHYYKPYWYYPSGSVGYATFGSTLVEVNNINNRLQPSTVALFQSDLTTAIINKNYNYGTSGTNNGNVLSITDVVWDAAHSGDTGRSQYFTYDYLNRVTAATEGSTSGVGRWGLSFTIDMWGNLTDQTVTKGSPTAFSNSVNASNQFTGYCYDASGNLLKTTSCGTADYTYDAENQVLTAGGYTYTYDAGGIRVKKGNGTVSTEYIYFGGNVIAEKDQAGTWADYIFVAGKRLAKASGTTSSGTQYYHGDHLGSERLMTDSSGSIVSGSEATYTPFGGEVGTSVTATHYKFTGKERDSESGNDYFGARYHSPSMGRFLTADFKQFELRHLINPQKLNKYAYVLNNPLALIDPDGLEDFNVFITYKPSDIKQGKNAPNWNRIKANALKHGNHVNVFEGEKATAAALQKSLSSGDTTVVIGHTQGVDTGNGQGPKAAAVSMYDKEVGQPGAPGQMGAGRPGATPTSPDVPAEMPNVSGGTVAIIGCDSQSLASQYSGADTFIGVDSGMGNPAGSLPTTSIDGLAAAGGALVDGLASGKGLGKSVKNADKGIYHDPKQDKGDQIVVKQNDAKLHD